MNSLVSIQHWLYGGVASGLGQVAGGSIQAIWAAMAAAVLFGAVHAFMPGHGKTILVSYHLGQPSRLSEAIANGMILALTHVGLALAWYSPVSSLSVEHLPMPGVLRNSRSPVVH